VTTAPPTTFPQPTDAVLLGIPGLDQNVIPLRRASIVSFQYDSVGTIAEGADPYNLTEADITWSYFVFAATATGLFRVMIANLPSAAARDQWVIDNHVAWLS
jgi:hypothetical protein